MNVVHALRDGTAGGGFSLGFIAQPVTDRGKREFRGTIFGRQTHSLAQLALTARKIPQLMVNQSQQAANRRAVESIGDGFSQHLTCLTGSPVVQQISGPVQGVRRCHRTLLP
jgi:hypothetical protein